MTNSGQVCSLYKTVVDDVINNVKEAFLDEGVDEQVLQELKQLWENKLTATKATEPVAEPQVHTTAPALNLLYQEAAQPAQQGFLPRGAVLTTTAQQPQQQSFPVTNQRPEMTGAAAQATMALPVGLFQQHMAALGQQGNVTLQQTSNGQYIAVQNIGGQPTTITLPPQAFLQQGQGAVQTQQIVGQVPGQVSGQVPGNAPQSGIIQLDGNGDGSSSSDDEDFDNDDNEDENEEENNEEEEQGEEEEPLNSADDVSDDDPTELFDAENVIVCQYDKINRNKNKWKFHLKDGIMNLNGKDFVFQRANGDAEW